MITRSDDTNYVPGERYLYTNSGWILAAQLVYRLTGRTLAQFAEERMFAPLGMRDTRFFADNAAVIPHFATAYAPRGDAFRVSRNSYGGAIMGAGGVHSTIEDFGRWLHNYDQGTVGGHDVISTMTTATSLNDGTPAKSATTQAYAVGLNVGTLRGVPMVSHGGSWAGFRAHCLRFPEQRVAVATFCNHSAAGPDSQARHVAAIYVGDAMQADSAALWRAALAAAPETKTDSATLGTLTGVWRHVARGEVRRTRRSGDTLLMITGTRTQLSPIAAGRYRAGADAELRFEGGAAVPERMFVRSSTDTMTFMRVDTAALSPANLVEYAGEYRNEEIETSQRWAVEKDSLVLFANERRRGTLEPTYADGFLRGESVIDVQRDARGRIAGYTVQSGRVRHLRFTQVR